MKKLDNIDENNTEDIKEEMKEELENTEEIKDIAEDADDIEEMENLETFEESLENESEKETSQEGIKKIFSNFSITKFKHGGVTTAMTALFIVLVIAVNILVGIFAERFPSVNIDLSAQKLNTLSETAIDAVKEVKEDIEIFVLASEEQARKNYISSAIPYEQIPNLLDKFKEANSKIKVTYIDLDEKPTFMNQYSKEDLATGMVIVQSAKRYKVLNMAGELFNASQDQQTGDVTYFSMVDGALANAIGMVNRDSMPVVAFASGHNELLEVSIRGGFENLLAAQGFEVKEFNVMTEEVPEETQIVVIPAPKTDYTKPEIEKLRNYLNDPEATVSRTVIYLAEPTQTEIPNLLSFLEEWGVQPQEGVIIETDEAKMFSEPSMMMVEVNGDIISDKSYTKLISIMTAPIITKFAGNDDIVVSSMWETGDTAQVSTINSEGEETLSEKGRQALATLSQRNVNKNKNQITENVIVFGSVYSFLDDFIAVSTFENGTYVSDLLSMLTGIEKNEIYVEQVQTSTSDLMYSKQTLTTIGMGVFCIAIPLLILAVGLVVFFRRRYK
jgi:ABC-type uncharacterized transport system.